MGKRYMLPLDHLIYRRQFIIGPAPTLRQDWRTVNLYKNISLVVHPDLDFAQICSNGARLYLLGYILDPSNPSLSNEEILAAIGRQSRSFEDLIHHTARCSGRWVIVYNDGTSVRILHDAIGMRQVFYVFHDGAVWCASQPSLLADELHLQMDDDRTLCEFLRSTEFEKNERFWPGEDTAYCGVKHLLPNHYLDLASACAIRYWPTEPLADISLSEAVARACEILSGTIESAANRADLMVAVTAGIDSRVVLAATRLLKEKIFYYVMKYDWMPSNHPDIAVPLQLLKRLGLELNVLELRESGDDEFREAFEKSVTLAREKLRLAAYLLYSMFSDRLRVSGIAGEIARSFYHHHSGRCVTSEILAEAAGYSGSEFARRNFARWLSEAEEPANKAGISIFDLFYWEQRIGNWAAMGSAECDIASEELTPFGNRDLLAVLLALPPEYRANHGLSLYKRLIKHMWPEALKAPFNPKPFSARIKRYVRSIGGGLLRRLPRKYGCTR